MAVIDILEDVNQKFTGTIVMYKNKAVHVKTVSTDMDKPGEFLLQTALPGARLLEPVNINDPALNFTNFNIGYANGGGYCAWWYRKPNKQWSQGLRSSQMGYKCSTPGAGPHDNFGFNRPFIQMMENVYPNIESCKKYLKDKESACVAFHRDFALSFDDLHDDYLLEYHGIRIGTSLDTNLKQFKIKSEARHLVEALQEARDAHS